MAMFEQDYTDYRIDRIFQTFYPVYPLIL